MGQLTSIAIVNYNTKVLLRDCIESSLSSGAGEVIVVDNDSTDGSAEMVRVEFPSVRLITSSNAGYGSAANLALEAATRPFLLLLNSDTSLTPGAVAALESHLRSRPSTAIAGPRLINPDGSLQPSCFPFPSALHLIVDVAGLVGVIQQTPVLRDRYLRTWSHNEARAVPWVVGAALAFRRDVVRDAGGFDEGYYMYFEEVDLSYRLGQAGWETHLVPDASVVHIGGASADQQRTAMQYQFCASRMRFIRTQYGSARSRYLLALLRVLTCYMLVRDTIRLRFVRKRSLRGRLAQDIVAWRMLLRDWNQPRTIAGPDGREDVT